MREPMDRTELVSSPGGGDRTEIVDLRPGVGRPGQVGAPSVALDCLAGHRYALSTSSSREHFLVQIRAAETQASRRMPLNLCLLIDRSGSMDGEPLDYVKRACGYVVDLLEPTDILSIVTFETQVDVLMPARRVVNRPLVKEHINRIEPGNTTNLYDGLVTAYRQAESAVSPAYLNRVLLLSDGDPTAGIRDFSTIVARVAEARGKSIATTALGFGPDYNEELMAGIARRSGGNYYFVDRPDRIPDVFRRELDQMMMVMAQDLRLRLRLSKWVQLRQVYGLQPRFVDRAAEVTLVDLDRGGTVNVLVEVEMGPRPAGVYRVFQAELNYRTDAPQAALADAVSEFTPDRARVEASVNAAVQAEIAVAQAARNLERTMMGVRTQQINIAAAAGELQRTQQLLTQAGRAGEANELGQAISALGQRDQNTAEKTIIGTIYNLDLGRRKS
ncbi:MAG TPA: VWA domain-containing protein [Armatimonadota bacterium]|nr:VWA domain-containing protein [Armatimonadota bacterium]